ncbi:MAG: hypothetical protein KJO73_06000 [Croceitalea sp.]|nr:hypothetical protein [Croceitalea sp.]NNC35490.1 hypothetical protein [Croceitalea sp.]
MAALLVKDLMGQAPGHFSKMLIITKGLILRNIIIVYKKPIIILVHN